jgi:hypothetical protein
MAWPTGKKDMRSSLCLGIVIAFCAILCRSHDSFPAENQQESSRRGEDIPLLSESQQQSLDSAQKTVTEQLIWAADWIDSFFDDKRIFVEENTSWATAKLAMGYSRNDAFEIKPRVDIRLRLPRLAESANIFIQAAEDTDFNIENDPLSDRLANNSDQNSEMTAGVRYFLKATDWYNISFDGGLSWNYLFAGARFRSLQSFGRWEGRFTDRLRYYTDDGWENKISYDLERRFRRAWLFRASTMAVISQEEEGIPHSQLFRLYQVLSPFKAISYETSIYFDTRPSYKVTDTQFVIRYRQRFFRNWLVLEISPRITFPEEHDRQMDPGIVVQLEAVFGYRADEEGYKKIFH